MKYWRTVVEHWNKHAHVYNCIVCFEPSVTYEFTRKYNKLCGRPPQYAPAPCKLTFDLESGVRVTCDVGYLCANFNLPIGLSVLDLGPMYATDTRQTSDRRQTLIIA